MKRTLLSIAAALSLLAIAPLGCDKEEEKSAEKKEDKTVEKVEIKVEKKTEEKAEEKAEGAADKKTVFFKSPEDGATVPPIFKIEFGVEGKEVVAADDSDDEGKGHHHIIVDGKPVSKGTVVPKDASHIHYGDGRTETEIELEPGEHTLTMQFANGKHESFGPDWATTITVTVAEGDSAAAAQ